MALAYYNEIDPYAAQWLRNLVAAGHIAAGDVDERSIEDVKPSELVGYTQCHFFAGIGVWSHALRQAGWPDDKPVWTGSCPCQPFSAAGKGGGFDDERHLWPAFHHLIEQCKPATVIGEQVASKDANAWIDLVQVDLETLGYAFGAVPFPSASVGAPHIRDRLYWVAYTNDGSQHALLRPGQDHSSQDLRGGPALRLGGRLASRYEGQSSGLDHHHHQGLEGHGGAEGPQREAGCAWTTLRSVGAASADCGLDNTFSNGRGAWRHDDAKHDRIVADAAGDVDRPGPVNGHWRAADWLFCRDGRWRPVEPSTFPLAHGATSRVGRLRAYGNAINAQAAQVFIGAYLES